MKNPYLSIIIRCRNDDHGGNMLRRMQLSLNGLFEQLEKHHIESEVILIESNPPVDMPLLKDILSWPKHLSYCTVRVVIIPSSIHQRYPYSDKMAMYTILSSNCGIRRARGEYILPGAIDLLYSDELMDFIATKGLKSEERYRVDRYDVDRNIVQYDTLKEQLDYCSKNIIRTNAYVPVKQRRFKWPGRDMPHLHSNASGDFQLMSKHYWHLLRGFREDEIIGSYCDSLLSYASYAAGVKEVILKDPIRLYHMDHDDKFTQRLVSHGLPLEKMLKLPFLPEWFNLVISGVYGRLLRFFGYKSKSSVNGIPTLDKTEYQKIAREMVAGKRSYVFNDEDWGLGQDSLEEFVICKADWDKNYGKN